MSSLFVLRPPGAVVTLLQDGHEVLLALAAVLEQALGQFAWSLGSLLLVVPVAALALVLGALVWRGRHPIAAVSVALAVQVAAFTDAWASLLRTLALVVVVALIAAPFAWGLALGLDRALFRRRTPVGGRTAPGRWQVAAPVALLLAPAAIVAVAVPTGLAWSLAAVTVAAGASGVLLALEARDPWWSAAVVRHATIALGVVLLTGLLGGPGLGAELARTVPTEEVSTAAELLVVIGATGVALLAVGWTLPRPLEATPSEPDADRAEAEPLGQEEISWRS